MADYTDADVELVAHVMLREGYGEGGWEHNDYHDSPDYDAARAVLDALADAGRLLPAEVRYANGDILPAPKPPPADKSWIKMEGTDAAR